MASRGPPSWNGETLETATLLDAHVRALSAADSYTADIQATNTANGDITLQFQLNASQRRVFSTVATTSRPGRAGYLTPNQSVIRIGSDDPTYTTDPGVSIERQLGAVATYQSDDFGISFGDSVRAFDYTHGGTTTFHGDTVFRFVSTSSDLGADAEAVLLVDARSVVRSAEFTVGDTTRTHEFTDINETTVSPPDWLADVPDSTTEEPENEGDDATIQDGDLVVDVTGFQWYWRFAYAESGITSNNELVVPIDRPVALRVTSGDVPHAFTIPDYDVAVDAKPDETDIARFTPSETGEILYQCTEDCGPGHSAHTGTVVVKENDAFEAWKENR